MVLYNKKGGKRSQTIPSKQGFWFEWRESWRHLEQVWNSHKANLHICISPYLHRRLFSLSWACDKGRGASALPRCCWPAGEADSWYGWVESEQHRFGVCRSALLMHEIWGEFGKKKLLDKLHSLEILKCWSTIVLLFVINICCCWLSSRVVSVVRVSLKLGEQLLPHEQFVLLLNCMPEYTKVSPVPKYLFNHV